jgi:gamma-glutamyl phosphate reductase
MVYESRPNVTIDAGALCLKSGNAVLLRGGKEARETNRALTDVLRAALAEHDLPADAVVMIPPGDRQEIEELVKLSGIIDLVIPRGGEGLIRFVAESARVPVIQHYKGVCHLFLDAGADGEMSLNLTLNGKVQRRVCATRSVPPGPCRVPRSSFPKSPARFVTRSRSGCREPGSCLALLRRSVWEEFLAKIWRSAWC